ncbi:MAG: WbuC family cupin fold metalloprotein [Magnetococcales bacterium]|nr:WbuC family cupin fold metalloprotein [Magnetococcales bacterium]
MISHAIGLEQLTELSQRAAHAPRRRMNLNLHPELSDPVQRMCNAYEPGTFIRPHRHPERWELFAVLTGRASLLLFDEGGRVGERVELGGASGVAVVEIPPMTWHSMVSLEPGTVLLEIKQGPFLPIAPEHFAPFGPVEGTPEAVALERWMQTAVPGQTPSGT